MIAKTDKHTLKSSFIALTLGFGGLLLQGCAGGAVTSSVYAASGAVATKLHLERQEFREELQKDYSGYQALFSGSGCAPEEYKVSPVIIEYLNESAPTEDGYAEAQDILLETYRDPTLSNNVRAHALYLAALGESQKESGSREQARDYLQQVTEEFPGTHDCAVNALLQEGDQIK
jgi:hypothetical protein